MQDPRELLQRLEVAVDAGGLPRDVGQWLKAGIAQHRKGASLEVALGLKPGPGVRAWSNAQRVKERDRWLIMAAQNVCEEPIGPWARAGRLAEAIRRFQDRTWPRIRHGKPPQSDAPTCDLITHYLILAHHAHPGDASQFPTSQRQLYRLLT